MVWLVFAVVALVFAVLALRVATRRRPTSAAFLDGRPFDLARSGLALLAAAVASVAAMDAHADRTIEFPPIVGLLAVAAVAALALALVPSGGLWSDGRRLATALVACVWIAVGLAVWPFAVMASACACGGDPSYVAPAPLGVDARGWITLATLSGPVLLLLAASRLPDRLHRASR